MTPNTHPIIKAANHVDDWDEGIGNSPTLAAARQNRDEANDFDFGQSAPAPVATKAAAKPVSVVATVEPIAAPAASQPATFSDLTSIPAPRKPSVVELAALREKIERDFAQTISAPPRDDASRNPFLARVLKVPTVAAALKVAKSEQTKYQKVLKDTAELIGSERHARDLLTAIEGCSDLTELESSAASMPNASARLLKHPRKAHAGFAALPMRNLTPPCTT